MKLYVKCQSCKSDFKLDKSYNTRPDLIAELDEYFQLNCTDCGSTKEYHANDVVAKDSVSGNLIGRCYRSFDFNTNYSLHVESGVHNKFRTDLRRRNNCRK